MKAEAAHEDTSLIDDAEQRFLDARNRGLHPPLVWHV